jgi:hypothetical protein
VGDIAPYQASGGMSCFHRVAYKKAMSLLATHNMLSPIPSLIKDYYRLGLRSDPGMVRKLR